MDSNAFNIIVTISILNIALLENRHNSIINYLSGLSLLVYIIHENYLLRLYLRPRLWQYIYEHYGYEHILLWVIVLTLLVLLFGVLASIIYHHTIQIIVKKIGSKLYSLLSEIWNIIERKLITALR